MPVYAIAGNDYLADATGGQLLAPLAWSYAYRSLGTTNPVVILEAEVAALQAFVAQVQARQLLAQSTPNDRMNALNERSSPNGSRAGASRSTARPPARTTCGWRSSKSQTPPPPLIIHLPWNMPNGVYDLLYCTNLAPDPVWQRLLRTQPGQTNLLVPNATDPQGFYRLGPPSDLAADNSLGTDFWLAFLPMVEESRTNAPSLYLSSPVGSTGTVTVSGFTTNDPVLVVTNCGDAAVNGTYNLGPLSPAHRPP